MDERLRFVARLLEGEKMAAAVRRVRISRKTGYKIFDRYKDCGVQAFTDRSRRPYRQANRLPPQLEAVIVRLKREYPGWGRQRSRKAAAAVDRPHLPAISTVHAVLDRHGLVHRRRRRRHAATGPRCRGRPIRTRSGAPTTRASSCSEPPVLLSADGHRLREPLPADV